MAKQVNGPQNKEQLKLMVDVVKREVNLAQDLLNSYQNDLTELEANSTMPDNEKESKRVFLETAIKESKEFLYKRQKQLKAIDPMKGGKKAGEARREAWNDDSLESKGMNAIIAEMSNAGKERKHVENAEKTKQERQARSEAVRNAAATLATAARKLAEEKDNDIDSNAKFIVIKRPDFIPESDKWNLINRTKTGGTFIFEDSNYSRYLYFPEIGEVIKTVNVGNKTLETYYDRNTNSWNQIPDEALQDSRLHYNSYMGQWMPYDFEKREWEEPSWQVPAYDDDGKLLFDERGKIIFRQASETEYEQFMINGIKTDEEKADLARRIRDSILGTNPGEKHLEDNNKEVTPKDLGKFALEDQKAEYGKWGPKNSDVILHSNSIQKQLHLNLFQKLKLWFMRLFNKNYQLPEARNNEFYLSDDIKKYKQDALDKSKNREEQKNKEKRIIRGYSKAKNFFKDNNKKLLALTALSLATIGMVFGINAHKEYNKNIIEQKAAEAQKEADLEAKRAQEEQKAIEEAAKMQEQEQQSIEQQDKLVPHDAGTLTTGSITKQYIAPKGLEYTEDSTGRGAIGTLANDTVVEIYNRAIVKENDDGTKKILLTSKGKTWEDYAKDSGMTIEEIESMLKQDKTNEMVAIQVGETNHNIFNTYGWVKTESLDESSKGTENLKSFEITTGDNTEILQQLQQNEKTNQNQETER